MSTPPPEAQLALNQIINLFVLQAVALSITVFLIPRLYITSIFGVILTVLSLALVNSFVWDAALFYSIPDKLSLKAATLLFANGVIFWVLVKLLPGIETRGLIPCLVAPVLFTFITLVLQNHIGSLDWLGLAQDGFDWIQGVRNELAVPETAEEPR